MQTVRGKHSSEHRIGCQVVKSELKYPEEKVWGIHKRNGKNVGPAIKMAIDFKIL